MSFGDLRRYDVYPKLNEEFRIKTAGGAIVSLLSLTIIFILFTSEFFSYLQVDTVDHLYVDVSRGEKVRINFDIIFPSIPCSLLSVDAMDVSGAHQLDVSHHIKKKAIDRDGKVSSGEVRHELGHTLNTKQFQQINSSQTSSSTSPSSASMSNSVTVDVTKQPGYCGSCYGSELSPTQCCRTCDAVKESYRIRGWALPPLTTVEQCLVTGQTDEHILQELERGDGCQIFGYLQVNKVAGNFHFAPGKSFQHAHMHVHDLQQYSHIKFNVSHIIKELSFGDPFPGIINPLDSVQRISEVENPVSMFMYYIKVVPTTYEYLYGSTTQTNQFSVTEHEKYVNLANGNKNVDGGGLPGVFFFYELSPIMVRFTEQRQNIFHFLTQLCAIVGGVFSLAGIVDRVVYAGARKLQQKNQQGKLS